MFTQMEIEVIKEGTARKIKELQAESKKEYPEAVKEAIQEYLQKLQKDYNKLA